MNNKRRKSIARLVAQLAELQSELQSIIEEENEAFDNMPEGLQYSERGDSIQECIDTLDSADSSLTDALDYLNEIINI